MDQIIQELLRYGWQGLVVAIVLGLARLIWPALVALLPQWFKARRAREDRWFRALQNSTKAMTEATAVCEAVKHELARLAQLSLETHGGMQDMARLLERAQQSGVGELGQDQRDQEMLVERSGTEQRRR